MVAYRSGQYRLRKIDRPVVSCSVSPKNIMRVVLSVTLSEVLTRDCWNSRYDETRAELDRLARASISNTHWQINHSLGDVSFISTLCKRVERWNFCEPIFINLNSLIILNESFNIWGGHGRFFARSAQARSSLIHGSKRKQMVKDGYVFWNASTVLWLVGSSVKLRTEPCRSPAALHISNKAFCQFRSIFLIFLCIYERTTGNWSNSESKCHKRIVLWSWSASWGRTWSFCVSVLPWKCVSMILLLSYVLAQELRVLA